MSADIPPDKTFFLYVRLWELVSRLRESLKVYVYLSADWPFITIIKSSNNFSR